jgi:phosphotransferase system enzyme I (PtsI)
MPFSLHGLSVSSGIAIGRALTIASAALEVSHRFIVSGDEEAEVSRLLKAFEIAKLELKDLRQNLPEDSPEEMGAFLDVHGLILDDVALIIRPSQLIRERRYNAAWALTTHLDELLEEFSEIEDPYLKERGADFRQVVERVLVALQGSQEYAANQGIKPFVDRANAEVIVVAHDIAPHDMLRFKDLNFCAFVTDLGGRNSHTAIVARSLDIPAAVGVKQASELIKQDDWLIVDGERGVVIVDPTPQILEEYRHRQSENLLAKKKLQLLKYTPTRTIDGVPISLMANIELPEDAVAAVEGGAVGVGLFRSEFLFMNRKGELPGEEEQFQAYRKTVEAMHGLPVNIRTIDIGADKSLDGEFDTVTPSISPLGLRAIRWSLTEPEIFLTQLRAILRASAFGQAQILVPMLAQVHEINQTLDLIDLAKQQLDERSISYNPGIKVGAMIELPAAAMVLPLFVKRFNFLSIGTNDLIQYTLGIDRADSAVAHLYDPLHPAVLKLIAQVIEQAKQANVSISVCGEMAGDAQLARLLLAMGLTDFSMHASQLLTVKREILRADISRLKPLLDAVLQAFEPEDQELALGKLLTA